MLFIEHKAQYINHGILRSSFVENFVEGWFCRKVIYLVINGFYVLAVKLLLARQNSFSVCCQQYIVIKRRNEQPSEPIEELRTKVDTATTAVANNISIIAVENNQSGDAR